MPKMTRYSQVALGILLSLLCVYYLGQLRGFFHDIWGVLSAVLFPFLIAMVLTYILQPVVEMLVQRKVPRTMAILMIYFVLLLLAVITCLNTIPVITRQFTQLMDNLPGLVQQGNNWIDAVVKRKQYLPDAVRVGLESAVTQAENAMTGSVSHIFSVITNAVSTIFAAFVVPFLVFYMLKDARTMGQGLVRLFPKSKREKAREVLAGVDETLGSYIRGQMLVMLAVGTLTYIGYLIIGMPYAMLLAILLAVGDMVPYLGPFIGAAPSILLALPFGWIMVVKVLIVNVIVQQCEGNLISPQIMGRTLRLHPMAIVAALLIGGEVAGLIGLIVAVPVLAVGKTLWIHLVIHPNQGEGEETVDKSDKPGAK